MVRGFDPHPFIFTEKNTWGRLKTVTIPVDGLDMFDSFWSSVDILGFSYFTYKSKRKLLGTTDGVFFHRFLRFFAVFLTHHFTFLATRKDLSSFRSPPSPLRGFGPSEASTPSRKLRWGMGRRWVPRKCAFSGMNTMRLTPTIQHHQKDGLTGWFYVAKNLQKATVWWCWIVSLLKRFYCIINFV